ncbi:ABC transporter ATP-binding protein [Aquamicrobium defluvii]|uniref:Amino acid/amide ABC transporter ATP-binding protein 2 (HAAT family) n=1 Tax=Aquamicrobium defluvii TaxID=69279 RepID=A0A4R6YDW3_9HYPH|nr:ABC transporter ATP-binding protein [Aquamicrobium defluvii]TDR34162.1 amino acid/amide ABC transporter ATP-binding protein 2 (HAAT family) [Aquamicrobium defluvii]
MTETNPSRPLLELCDIHTYYGESYILQGESLELRHGQCLALLGRNGAGKTTTLRSIVGLTPIRRGRIAFNGKTISDMSTHRIIAQGIGYVPENRGIFGSLTVREHIEVAMWARGCSAARRDQVLAIFPRISERMGHLGHQLSGGEQQMLAIARAMLADPVLLILDEPSEGLAPVIVEEVRATLARIKETGTSILLVEQNAAMAMSLADTVTVLSQGMVQFAGTPAGLEARADIKNAYLGIS